MYVKTSNVHMNDVFNSDFKLTFCQYDERSKYIYRLPRQAYHL